MSFTFFCKEFKKFAHGFNIVWINAIHLIVKLTIKLCILFFKSGKGFYLMQSIVWKFKELC